MGTIDIFNSYILVALAEEIVPKASFFRDRYFPTEEMDIFAADKVLTEYKKGDRKMASFIADRVGDIPVERRGSVLHEYEPPMIAPSRPLTLDDLKKRGFGEALLANSDKAERAARIIISDMKELDERIARREEWMAAQVMLNNACTIQEYIDADTVGNEKYIHFYDGDASEHKYIVANPWNSENGNFFGDVKAMCRLLSRRGLKAADLVLGSDVADVVLNLEKVQKLLDKNSGIIIGQIEQELSKYDGVVYMGTLNFGGFKLNLISADETYEDESGKDQKYFGSTTAMVTAPGCGHMMYAEITQIDHGSSEFSTNTGMRIPKLIVNQDKDTRKFRLAARPLAAPKNYCPYIVAENVVG